MIWSGPALSIDVSSTIAANIFLQLLAVVSFSTNQPTLELTIYTILKYLANKVLTGNML